MPTDKGAQSEPVGLRDDAEDRRIVAYVCRGCNASMMARERLSPPLCKCQKPMKLLDNTLTQPSRLDSGKPSSDTPKETPVGLRSTATIDLERLDKPALIALIQALTTVETP